MMSFKIFFSASPAVFNANFGVLTKIGESSAEHYDGDYSVVPKAFAEQTLETQGKIMNKNVTVKAVPYFETSNEEGTTIFIASEVE